MSRQEKGGWTNTCWQIQASDSVCVHAQETAPLQSLILFWNRHLTVLCLYIEMFMHLKASFKQSHAAQCGNQKLPIIIILQKSELIYMVWMIYSPSSPKKKKSVKKLGVQHGNHCSWGSNYLCSMLFSLADWQHCTVWIPHCAFGKDVFPSQEYTPTWTLLGAHTDVFLLAGTEALHTHLATCNLWHIQLTSGTWTSHLLLMWWGYFTYAVAV